MRARVRVMTTMMYALGRRKQVGYLIWCTCAGLLELEHGQAHLCCCCIVNVRSHLDASHSLTYRQLLSFPVESSCLGVQAR